MKNALESLLTELAQQGIQVKVAENERLLVNAPRGGVSEGLRQQLVEHKSALIEWLTQNQKESLAQDALPVIAPDPAHRHDPFPMADLQAGFFIGQSEDMEYHVRPHFYIEEDFDALDVVRFEAALNVALYQQRYNLPIVTPDLQLQVPQEFQPVQLKIYDLRNLPEEVAQAALMKTRETMSREILPLDRWPSEDFRVSLYAEKRVRLHVNHNNFFGDGYGTSKLFAVAMDYYRHGKTPPELSLTFRDCVLALAKLEESSLGQTSRRYWEERLPGLPTAPSIPLVPGSSARTRSRLTVRKMQLPAPLWAQLKRWASQVGLTPSNALTAVYAQVISQWSGSRHFLLNNMVTHRFPMHAEIMNVFGNFASLYPLEVDWREGGTFAKRALLLQERLMNDMRHLYWSGMRVLQALNQVQKTPGRASCPFVVGSGLFIKGWEEFYYSCLETPQVLLDYQFWELTNGSLLVAWDLIESAFPPGLIDGMQHAFEALLQTLAQDERAWALPSFDLLPPTQRGQRVQMNQTKGALPQGLLQDGLASNASRYPNKVAVIAADRELTYAQLYSAANRLGHCLREAGAQPNQFVAILNDKGWEQAVAAFGILAAGSPYIPIDPNWPQERIHFLLKDTQTRIVVTSRKQRLPALPADVQVIFVDPELERFPDTPLSSAQSEDDLAYVIYTSGSTGVPKGVMINHCAALNTVADINRRFSVTESDVLFGISSLYFDLSVYDLFGTIAAGATLVLPPASDSPDPTMWVDAIQRHGVTVWSSVPALMQLMVDAANASNAKFSTLKLVMMSGDWIPIALPDQIRRLASGVRIISLGGATEAAIWSIYYPIEKIEPSWSSIPYGKPLANQTWHILNESGEDAPVWVPGHLHIGGEGLALGYWHDAQKTATAFISHPRSGERIYRTGDLGRYLPDGNIEFLGRADFQVKIQGYRVELGEIEAVLSQHPDVVMAAVIAQSSGAGKQLTAFLVTPLEKHIESVAVQAYLRSKLPAYMVPSHIVSLEQLPLTANGKLDRAALMKLGPSSEARREFIAPRNAIERELAAIWEEVLEIKPIGIRDDFFDLGGQSFAAIRVVTRITQQFGRRLPLSVLLEERTIEALANNLHKQEAWSPVVQLHPKQGGIPYFFVHPAGGNVMCYRGFAEKLDAPFYGLQAVGLLGEQKPLESIEQMAALYVDEMRKVRPSGPYVLGGWSSGGMIAFEMARQLETQNEKVERIVMIDAPAPMQAASIDDVTLLQWFLEDLNIGIDLTRINIEEIKMGTPAAALRVMLAHQTDNPNLDVDQLESVLSVFIHIVRAGRRYRPMPISADITVLRASEGLASEFTDHPALADSDWGWSHFTQGRVDSVEVPGNHYTVLSEGNIDVLVTLLSEKLTREKPVQVSVDLA
ncbi:MAG: amino acid adenylation domain-containing protein [Pseudomonadota bacterium]